MKTLKKKNKYKSKLNEAMLFKHFSGSTCLREDFYDFMKGQIGTVTLINYASKLSGKEGKNYLLMLHKKYGAKLRDYIFANRNAFAIEFDMHQKYNEVIQKYEWE